jgi:RNA 2',3'-cyclic 3'-phosphodiesterase
MAGRYFLGVDVPAASIGPELVRLQGELKPHLDLKRWYSPEQMHLTVQFMGNMDDGQVERLQELVAPAVQDLPAFTLELGEVGWFPRAKVVWCGVKGELNLLQQLQKAVVTSLAPAFDVGTYNHDAFRPHITLGRLHSAQGSLPPVQAAGLSWRVDGLHLYESVSAGPKGPDYPVRHTFVLQ